MIENGNIATYDTISILMTTYTSNEQNSTNTKVINFPIVETLNIFTVVVIRQWRNYSNRSITSQWFAHQCSAAGADDTAGKGRITTSISWILATTFSDAHILISMFRSHVVRVSDTTACNPGSSAKSTISEHWGGGCAVALPLAGGVTVICAFPSSGRHMVTETPT